jgi:hypothetical protein
MNIQNPQELGIGCDRLVIMAHAGRALARLGLMVLALRTATCLGEGAVECIPVFWRPPGRSTRVFCDDSPFAQAAAAGSWNMVRVSLRSWFT